MQFSAGPRLRARVSPTGHFLELLPPAVPFLPAAEGDAPCPRARVTFGRSPKSDQKRCLKPQVSKLPARLGCAENRGRVPRENQDSADRRTTNRVRSSCRCRSCVPCGGALVCRCGRLSNRALAAAGKCRCGPSGCGRENHKRCKALSLYRTNGEISPVERGSGSGNGGGKAIQGFASGGSIPFQQRKGMLRALGHGSLLAAAPKVTKNAA